MAAAAQHPIWTSEQDEVLMRLYPCASWEQILSALPGRTRRAVWKRAHRLGSTRKRQFSLEERAALAARTRKLKPRLGKVIYPVVDRNGVSGKFCSHCGEWFPLRRFAKQPDCSGGVRNICTTCEGRAAYRRNPALRIKAVRAYQKRNPEAHRLRQRAADRRRHKKKIAGRGVSVVDLRELIAMHGGFCAYCKIAEADTIDHVMPLSRGGQHEIENILPACKACNFEKHTMTLEEWQAKKVND